MKKPYTFAQLSNPLADGGRKHVRLPDVYIKEPLAALLATQLDKTLKKFFAKNKLKVSGHQTALWVK